MPGRAYEVTMERVIAAPRRVVWGLIADTNRWDRASGLTPGRYSWRELDGRHVRVGNARELGFDIEWIEPPYEWVEGRSVRGSRRFLKGPVATGGFHATVDDAQGGTRLIATAYVGGDGALMPVLGRVMQARFGTALRRYLDSLEAAIRASQAGDTEPQAPRASVEMRDRLSTLGYDAIVQGPRSATALDELGRRAARLRGQVPDELVERVVTMLSERPDEEVAQMRPFELAAQWHVDRRQLLRVFLHGTRAGLWDLRWQINCPVCRVAAQVVGTLADVTGSVHCAACNIAYDVDFGQHVEAVFQCHPAIRVVDTAVYCASSPSLLPHVVAQLVVERGTPHESACELAEGSYLVRTVNGTGRAQLTLQAGQGMAIELRDGTLHAQVTDDALLRLRSDSPTSVISIEQAGDDGRAVLGSVVASFPDFLDLFATEAPASGVELSIAHLALLFSDLTGSTALYQQVGDARAFAVVQEHFRDMTELVQAHGGAIVKTMGDAVMATFTTERDAIAAAVAMVKRCREHHGAQGLGAKLGVYAGPCLAVRANDRLDFFGTTVNLAARLQAQAEGGQLVITAEQARAAELQALIAPYPQAPFKAHLKGITTEQDLIALHIT